MVKIPVHAELESSQYRTTMLSLVNLAEATTHSITKLQSQLRLLVSQTDLVDVMPESSVMKAAYSNLVSDAKLILRVSGSPGFVGKFEVRLTHVLGSRIMPKRLRQ